jgi:CO/xanthine dehydrogenase FAD-binding subunit
VASDRRGDTMIPAPFDYEVADSVEHAVELLGERDDTKLLAGGHSLIPLMRLRFARPAVLVDLGRLDSLRYVRDAGEQLAIGALARHHDLKHDPLLQEHCPLVSYTAGLIGDPQVRHRGTIGGSVAHGDPASDLPAVLLALDADLVVQGPDGERTVPADAFFRGVFETALGPQDVLTEIRVPKLGPSGWAYLKFTRARPGLGDRRRGGGRPALERDDRRYGDRADEHGPDAGTRARRRRGVANSGRRRGCGRSGRSRERSPKRHEWQR